MGNSCCKYQHQEDILHKEKINTDISMIDNTNNSQKEEEESIKKEDIIYATCVLES